MAQSLTSMASGRKRGSMAARRRHLARSGKGVRVRVGIRVRKWLRARVRVRVRARVGAQ